MTDTPEQLISDEHIQSVWKGAGFGPHLTQREVIRNTLLKFACGWAAGRTAHRIVADLGLACVNKQTLTKRGKAYLWACYYNGSNGEIAKLRAENEKMWTALQEVQVLARRGIFPGMPVEVLGAQMCIDINKLVTETFKKDGI